MTTYGTERRGLARRRVLLAGGGVAAAAALGVMSFAASRDAYAEVGDSTRFKLDGSGGNPIWRKRLQANWVMQSFAYDNVNGHVYFVQCKSGDKSGDLWVTKTDPVGNKLGAMALHGFGHGVQIAVEPHDGAVYLWTEWMVRPSGFGDRIGRFRFADGATLEQGDSRIQDVTPRIGPDGARVQLPQPAIDPQFDRLLVRYKVGEDKPRIAVFPLGDARAGRLDRANLLADRALPSRGTWGGTHPFQGFTAHGRYAYLLEGAAGVTTSYLTTIDLNDVGQSTVVDRFPTTAGKSLANREPQGMAIWLARPPAGPVQPRLAFGMYSNTDGIREASVFYKGELG